MGAAWTAFAGMKPNFLSSVCKLVGRDNAVKGSNWGKFYREKKNRQNKTWKTFTILIHQALTAGPVTVTRWIITRLWLQLLWTLCMIFIKSIIAFRCYTLYSAAQSHHWRKYHSGTGTGHSLEWDTSFWPQIATMWPLPENTWWGIGRKQEHVTVPSIFCCLMQVSNKISEQSVTLCSTVQVQFRHGYTVND